MNSLTGSVKWFCSRQLFDYCRINILQTKVGGVKEVANKGQLEVDEDESQQWQVSKI